jgi:hypothetical protein
VAIAGWAGIPIWAGLAVFLGLFGLFYDAVTGRL